MSSQFDILEQLPGYIGWKDTQFTHLGCNQQLASILNLASPKNIIGFKDEELPGCNEATYQFHRKNDELALNGKTITVLHRSSQPYDGSLFFSVKKPLYDINNQIHGIIYQCHAYKNNSFFTTIEQYANTSLSQSYYHIEASANPYKLTERELESLFCVLHGMTAKQTAECLSISKRTVETYLENIKNKFSCSTKSEMIVTGMNAGYINHIPHRFLNTK